MPLLMSEFCLAMGDLSIATWDVDALTGSTILEKHLSHPHAPVHGAPWRYHS